MARKTNFQLSQELSAAADENAALRAQLSQLQADNARLKAERDAALEDENDRAYARAVVEAETPEFSAEEGRKAFFSLNSAFRAALARMYCRATGARSTTPEEAGCFYLSRRADNERG